MIKKVLALLLLVVIILCVIMLLTKCDGKFPFGIGIGNGNNSSSLADDNGGVSSSSSVVKEVTEAPETTEEVTAEPATDEVQYIEVTVSGSNYIYQNSTLTLDELMEQIQGTDLTVKLTDDKASKKAYDDILQALDEKNIPHIE